MGVSCRRHETDAVSLLSKIAVIGVVFTMMASGRPGYGNEITSTPLEIAPDASSGGEALGKDGRRLKFEIGMSRYDQLCIAAAAAYSEIVFERDADGEGFQEIVEDTQRQKFSAHGLSGFETVQIPAEFKCAESKGQTAGCGPIDPVEAVRVPLSGAENIIIRYDDSHFHGNFGTGIFLFKDVKKIYFPPRFENDVEGFTGSYKTEQIAAIFRPRLWLDLASSSADFKNSLNPALLKGASIREGEKIYLSLTLFYIRAIRFRGESVLVYRSTLYPIVVIAKILLNSAVKEGQFDTLDAKDNHLCYLTSRNKA